MKKIKARSIIAGPEINMSPGDEALVEENLAKALILSGAAELMAEATPKESAEAPPAPETAALGHSRLNPLKRGRGRPKKTESNGQE